MKTFIAVLASIGLSICGTSSVLADEAVPSPEGIGATQFLDVAMADLGAIEEIVESNDVVVVVESKADEALLWADNLGRSMSAVEGGFQLTLIEGDRIEIAPDGSIATWYNQDEMGLIEFDVQALFEDEGGKFFFDVSTGILATFVHDLDNRGLGGAAGRFSTAKRTCANKWVAAGWNILWDVLVCVPAGAGTGGAAAVPCGALGTVISAAASC